MYIVGNIEVEIIKVMLLLCSVYPIYFLYFPYVNVLLKRLNVWLLVCLN